MKTMSKKLVTFKNGETWPAGICINIEINENNPGVALINRISNPEDIKRCKSINLFKWFKRFESFTTKDIDQAIEKGYCPSLTGEKVEPDGWDHENMPSFLLACGMI